VGSKKKLELKKPEVNDFQEEIKKKTLRRPALKEKNRKVEKRLSAGQGKACRGRSDREGALNAGRQKKDRADWRRTCH